MQSKKEQRSSCILNLYEARHSNWFSLFLWSFVIIQSLASTYSLSDDGYDINSLNDAFIDPFQQKNTFRMLSNAFFYSVLNNFICWIIIGYHILCMLSQMIFHSHFVAITIMLCEFTSTFHIFSHLEFKHKYNNEQCVESIERLQEKLKQMLQSITNKRCLINFYLLGIGIIYKLTFFREKYK